MIVKFLNIPSKSIVSSIEKYEYILGIKKGKNTRREVDHSTKVSTSRGISNRKNTKRSSVTNTQVVENLIEKQKFDFYIDSFNPQKNPNYNTFIKSLKYINDKSSRRFENAIVANVKAYLDFQRIRNNTKSTIRQKGFNKFGIDSRQMQMSLESERITKK